MPKSISHDRVTRERLPKHSYKFEFQPAETGRQARQTRLSARIGECPKGRSSGCSPPRREKLPRLPFRNQRPKSNVSQLPSAAARARRKASGRLQQICCNQRMLSHRLPRHIAGHSMQMNRRHHSLENSLRILRDQPSNHPGKNVSRTACSPFRDSPSCSPRPRRPALPSEYGGL